MLLQQHLCSDESSSKSVTITDSEVLIWSHKNANSEYINANNCLQIIIDLCLCSAKDTDLSKVIRSQIDIVSNQLSHKSYQTLIHCSNESDSSIASSSDEEVAKCRDNETESLRNTQILLQKKYKLLCLLRSELANSRCQCLERSPSNGSNVLTHLRKSEFNFKMWYRHIKLIEAKIECKQLSMPFDVIKVMRQLLADSNEQNFNSNSILPTNLDFNNNNSDDNSSNHNTDKSDNCVKNENFGLNDEQSSGAGIAGNDCSYSSVDYSTNEYENENSLSKSTKNMQILRFDSLLSVNSEQSLTLQPINGNDMNEEMMANMEMDSEVRTFQELHPINSSNIGLNYSAHDISLMRSNATLHHEFDYRNNGTETTPNTSHFGNDLLLPQMTAIEIDQILNN